MYQHMIEVWKAFVETMIMWRFYCLLRNGFDFPLFVGLQQTLPKKKKNWDPQCFLLFVSNVFEFI